MNRLNKLIDNLPGFDWASQPNSGDVENANHLVTHWMDISEPND